RGKVDFALYTESLGEQNNAHLNIPLMQAYYKDLMQASASLQLPLDENIWSLLMRMPNVMQGDSFDLPEDEWPQVQEVIAMAIDQLISFRTQEGNMLYQFFNERIDQIESLLAQVEPYENERVEKIKQRLLDALEKLGPDNYDKNRFEQELIYYLEKLDITEEKTRLSNHCDYFRQTMDEQETKGGKGKKLGFIIQEMGREINTLGSKSNQAEMQRIVVCMKDCLEQMKEQILNVL
ncbi:MAG: DUF1732 domain-containing protein, partial [Bacteroidales bacterium]|nr:DUF1732 domain-containing protein [Bacteroidales bacterium]